MFTTRWIAGTAVAAITATSLAFGAGTALADTPAPTPTADHANSAICTTRIPAILARIDKLTTRINGDATVRGSTAWVQAKADQARSAGYSALGDLLAQRAADRPAKLTELAQLKTEVQHVQATDCAA